MSNLKITYMKDLNALINKVNKDYLAEDESVFTVDIYRDLNDDEYSSTRILNMHDKTMTLEVLGDIVANPYFSSSIILYQYLAYKTRGVVDMNVYYIVEEYNKQTGISNLTMRLVGYVEKSTGNKYVI